MTGTAKRVRLYHRLQVAAHSAQKHSDRRMLAATGMSTAQVAVLTVLSAGASTTQRDVALALGVNESAVTSMVRRLEQRGALTRAADPIDRRARALELTAGGRDVLAHAREAFASVNAIVEEALSSAEIEALAASLELLSTRFSDALAVLPDTGP